MANCEIGKHLDGQTAGGPRSQTSTLVGTRNGHGQAGERSHRQPRAAPASNLEPRTESRPGPTTAALARANERQRLARDLHDGVQTELASLREIACDIYPLPLTKLGLSEALRALAARAPIKVSVAGTAPRTTNEAEAAMYFCCSEAIQNAAKHAGRSAQVKLGLHHHHGRLAARIADDGRGFDPAQTPDGAGLRNIRERVQALNGTLRLTSTPGHGTVLTISLPWPAAADGRR